MDKDSHSFQCVLGECFSWEYTRSVKRKVETFKIWQWMSSLLGKVTPGTLIPEALKGQVKSLSCQAAKGGGRALYWSKWLRFHFTTWSGAVVCFRQPLWFRLWHPTIMRIIVLAKFRFTVAREMISGLYYTEAKNGISKCSALFSKAVSRWLDSA